MGKPSVYFVMASETPDQMLLADLEAVGDPEQQWIEGTSFPEPPAEPVRVGITEDYEEGVILDWFDYPPVMTRRFYEALRAAGVDNLQAFDAYLESEDGKVRHDGFKAVNVIGVVSMASAQTRFSPGNPSRLIDTHIDQMSPDTSKAHALHLFRLAESLGHVVVSARVKAHLEGRFPHLVFRPLQELVT